MGINFMAYCPHPPIAIPEIGDDRRVEVGGTVTALEQLGHELVAGGKDGIETIICVTPHGPVFQDAVTVWQTPTLTGNLQQFGAGKVSLALENDLELALEIIKGAERDRILTAQLNSQLAQNYRINPALDHGIIVPLYFFPTLQQNQVKLVAISIGFLTSEELYRFGIAVAKAIDELGRKVAIVISGDLSHRLQEDAPGGFHPKGKEFDHLVVSLLEQGEAVELLNLDPSIVEQAGECGFRPLAIALGILDKQDFQAKVLSYEAPFGVGYLVAKFELKQELTKGRLNKILAVNENRLRALRKQESPPVKLARLTVEQLVKEGKVEPVEPGSVPLDGLTEPKGVFVSLKKKGQLRGCIGTIEPEKANAALEITENAVKAAMKDPRFEPVRDDELEELEYSVDILDSPEPVASEAELDPAVYGVIVSAGAKKGLLLPDLPGVESASQQVAIAKQKAGINPGEKVQLYRFKVTRYT